MNFNKRILFSLILFLILPVSLFNWYIFDLYRESQFELLQTKIDHRLDSVDHQFNMRLNDTLQKLRLITNTPSLQTYLRSDEPNLAQVFTPMLAKYLSTLETDAYISIYRLDTTLVATWKKTPTSPHQIGKEQQVLEQLNRGQASALAMQQVEGDQRWHLLGIPIMDDSELSPSPIGYLLFGSDLSSFMEFVTHDPSSAYSEILVIDDYHINALSMINTEENKPSTTLANNLRSLANQDTSWETQANLDGINYLTQVNQYTHKTYLGTHETYLIGLYPKELIQTDFVVFITQLILYSGLLIGVLFLAIYGMVKYEIISPITQLLHATDSIIKGRFNFKASTHHKGVLAALEQQFEKMSINLLNTTAKLKTLAFYDKLTKLPNRTSFNQDLRLLIKHSESKNYKFGLMFIDLDGFKNINDNYGHELGDQVLVAVAQRIAHAIDTPEYFASNIQEFLPYPHYYRLGGDEFTFVFAIEEDIEAESKWYGQQVLKLFETPFEIEHNKNFKLGISIGIAAFPEHGKNYTTLLKNADIAMYYTKEHGKKGCNLYNLNMSQDNYETMQLREALPKALKLEQFELNFQPIFNINQTMMGYEVLLRWKLDNQFIPPDSFIPIAEETGDIIEIGAWVIEEAICHLHQLNRDGFKLNCTINLSVIQLKHSDLLHQLGTIMARYPIDPRSICFEITESIMLDTTGRAKNQLQRLRAMDFHIAIDDFGTGYSSLARLRSLPVSVLKIDKTFIFHVDENKVNQAIVRSTIAMAKALNLKVVAEGIEDLTYIDILDEFGCEYLQGYALAKPLDANGLAIFIREHGQEQTLLSSIN